MGEKELELTDEQLKSITGGTQETYHFKCPHCGSTNIIPFHSPSKGTAYLCCECYNSFNEKDLKE